MSTKKLTQDIFISRCKEIYGDKFDYSKSEYINMFTKVTIKCNTCNQMWDVTPGNHLGPRKSGCPRCKCIRHQHRMDQSTLSLEEFINRSNGSHNNKFDYSKSEYINSSTKVAIICPIHGEFEQWPQDHMRGIGCAKCSGSVVEHDKFIKEIELKYPIFDFSKFEYKSAKIKSIVICPLHGEFNARPNDLNFGHGCKECGIHKQQETKITRGIVTDPKDKTEYENYRRAVWRISNRNYKLHKETINPLDLPRNLKYHLDHIYPIQKGWLNGKSPEEIGHQSNLQILEGISNRRKGCKLQ